MLLLCPCALMARGSSLAHLATWLWLAQGTSGRADVGLGEGVTAVVCFHLSSPLFPPWVAGHLGYPVCCCGVGRRRHTESCPIPPWGWGGSLAPGGSRQPQAGQSLAQDGDLLCCLQCQAGRVEGPYGPVCAGLINTGCRSGTANPINCSQRQEFNPFLPPNPPRSGGMRAMFSPEGC